MAYFDERRSAFASTDLPKVYHLNVAVKISHTGTTAPRPARIELLRVILRKDGIVRTEQVTSAEGPSAFSRWG